MERVWTCSCPVCRLIAYPLLRRMLRGLRVREESLEEVGEVAEAGEKPKPGDDSEELRRLVEALRDSVLELRSAISDLTSPFNMMRREEAGREMREVEEAGAQEEPVPVSASAKHASMYAQPQVKPVLVGVRETPPAVGMEEALGKHEGGSGEKPASKPPLKPPVKPPAARPGKPLRLNMGRVLRLLKMMYELRRKLSSQSIGSLIRMLVVMGVISEGDEEAAKHLLEFVDEGIKNGLSPEDQALIIYSLAKTLGVEDEELEEEVMSLLLRRLRGGGDWGSQQQ